MITTSVSFNDRRSLAGVLPPRVLAGVSGLVWANFSLIVAFVAVATVVGVTGFIVLSFGTRALGLSAAGRDLLRVFQ